MNKPMTVQDVIDFLSKMSDESRKMPFVICGYEGGVEEVCLESFVKVKLKMNENDAGVYGPHAIEIDGDIPAILITRGEMDYD